MPTTKVDAELQASIDKLIDRFGSPEVLLAMSEHFRMAPKKYQELTRTTAEAWKEQQWLLDELAGMFRRRYR